MTSTSTPAISTSLALLAANVLLSVHRKVESGELDIDEALEPDDCTSITEDLHVPVAIDN